MALAGSRLALLRSARWLSTATETTNTVTVNKGDTLFSKLRVLDGSEEAKIEETLNEWIKEKKSLRRIDIVGSVKQLRISKQYNQAIQVYEWMEKNKHAMNDGDYAIRINLLGKLKGAASAEEYFDSLQESAKTQKTYGALLNCYCQEKMLENAEKLFEKITALGFSSTLNINNLMGLYLLIGQPEKVLSIAQEMEAQNIPADMYTYNILINSYASLKEFDGIDEVMKKMVLNKVKADWFTIMNLATIYINNGNLDNKADIALKEMEQMEKFNYYDRFHTLITLYARTSNLSGVNRVWESLKSTFPEPVNTSYLVLLLALSKLGDFDALEKYFREWESKCASYDVRVSNVLLESYLKRDMLEEANLVYENAVKKGAEPNLRTLEVMANYYIGKREIDIALKYVEMAPSKAKPEKLSWFPSDETVRMFLERFEEDYDAEKAEKFSIIMKKIGRLDSTVLDSLLRTNIAAGGVESQASAS